MVGASLGHVLGILAAGGLCHLLSVAVHHIARGLCLGISGIGLEVGGHTEVGIFKSGIRGGEPRHTIFRHEVALAVGSGAGVDAHGQQVGIVCHEQGNVVGAAALNVEGCFQCKTAVFAIKHVVGIDACG